MLLVLGFRFIFCSFSGIGNKSESVCELKYAYTHPNRFVRAIDRTGPNIVSVVGVWIKHPNHRNRHDAWAGIKSWTFCAHLIPIKYNYTTFEIASFSNWCIMWVWFYLSNRNRCQLFHLRFCFIWNRHLTSSFAIALIDHCRKLKWKFIRPFFYISSPIKQIISSIRARFCRYPHFDLHLFYCNSFYSTENPIQNKRE